MVGRPARWLVAFIATLDHIARLGVFAMYVYLFIHLLDKFSPLRALALFGVFAVVVPSVLITNEELF